MSKVLGLRLADSIVATETVGARINPEGNNFALEPSVYSAGPFVPSGK